MHVNELVRRYSNKSKIFVSENSPSILTAVGVTGTVTTAYLTGSASFKAAERIRLEEERQQYALDRGDRIKMVAPLYIPAVGVGVVTIAAIILANRLGTKKAAALAAAYGISERAFTEYKEKVIERIGTQKEQAIREEIAQDKLDANPVATKEVIMTGGGEVLCYDSLTGRYFQSTVETIRQAANAVNYDILHHMFASLSSFYEKIGLSPTAYSDDVGWNTDHLLELQFSTGLATDGRPCLVLDFLVGPKQDYSRLY